MSIALTLMAAVAVGQAEGKFEPLFNGKDLQGWKGAVENYEVKDGAIVCKPKKGGVLFTEQTFEDFVVRVEFKLPPGGNNGIAIRYPGKGRASGDGMGEIQLLDDDDPKYAKLDARQYNGSWYGIAAAKRGQLKPVGAWNTMEVEVVGSTVKVTLNGARILEADGSKVHEYYNNYPHPGKDLKAGHLGLCGHNDPVAVRKFEVKRIGKKS